MEFTGVYHKTSEQMSYPLDEDRLVINLKTGYDVKQVFIHHGDPFDAGILGGNEKWTGRREEVVYKKRLPTSSGGRQRSHRLINGANIILNSVQRRKSGIISRTVF